MTGSHPIRTMLKVLGVSSSGYYDWLSSPDPTPDHPELRLRIRHHFNRSRCSYGHRWIRKELRDEGQRVGRKLVLRLMKEEGLKPCSSLPHPYKKGVAGEHRVAKNRLRRAFDVRRANRLWTSDITYIWTDKGWAYLAIVLDLFARRIVGWEVGDRPDTALVRRALMRAVSSRKPRRWRLMFHSDQGCQYTSLEFVTTLRDLGILQSMSRRGQCWDNAPTESFFASMKKETGIAKWVLQDAQAVQVAMIDWIENWYNPLRRHSTLDGCSPVQFELRKAA